MEIGNLEIVVLLSSLIISVIGGIFGICSFFIGHKREEKIEELKGKLKKDKYVLEIKFTAEFEMLKELSESSAILMNNVSTLLSRVADREPGDKIEIKFDYLEEIENNYNFFLKRIFSSAPFLSRELYNSYFDLKNNFYKMLHGIKKFYLKADYNKDSKDDLHAYDEWIDITNIVHAKFNALIPKVRSYLKDYFEDKV